MHDHTIIHVHKGPKNDKDNYNNSWKSGEFPLTCLIVFIRPYLPRDTRLAKIERSIDTIGYDKREAGVLVSPIRGERSRADVIQSTLAARPRSNTTDLIATPRVRARRSMDRSSVI